MELFWEENLNAALQKTHLEINGNCGWGKAPSYSPINTIMCLPYLPYIFGRIKIIIFFTVRTFNLEKNSKFFSVRIFMNAEKLPIIEGIHRYICGNLNVYTDRCENKQFV